MNTSTLLLLLSLPCGFDQPLVGAERPDVSLVQLIANPKDYDGKFVRVVGFVSMEFEGNAIYLHEDDYRHSIFKNGLWIGLTDDMQKNKADLDKRYLVIEGTFNANEYGHMGAWSGTIEKITRYARRGKRAG